MVDVMIRDISSDVVKSIDVRSKAAKMSRQQFLAQHLQRSFGSEGSLVAAIAGRLRWVFSDLSQIRFYTSDERVTVPRIAEMLGYSSPLELESFIQGENPLTFEAADRLCSMLGINREWLLDGEYQPYFQAPVYHNIEDCFRDVMSNELKSRNGHPYTKVIFVLSDDKRGEAAVYGMTKEAPFRCDLLLRDIPIGDYVGGGGASDIMEFAWMLAAIELRNTTKWGTRAYSTNREFYASGRIKDRVYFDLIKNGGRHAAVLNELGEVNIPWISDLWELDFKGGNDYTPGFAGARKLYLKQNQFRDNDELIAYLKERFHARDIDDNEDE
jgi:hypothetical protein